MTPKERAAMQQALEALEKMFHSNSTKVAVEKYNTAHSALREALAEQPINQDFETWWEREGFGLFCDKSVKTAASVAWANGSYFQQMVAEAETRIPQQIEALAEQAEQEPVAQQDSDDRRLLREIFMLCEATEELESTNDFMRGRIFEAKCIRRGIGTWYQDTFCGRSYMGEPVLNAAPVQQAEQEPVAERKAQVNELIKESARLIASISDEGDRYLTAIDTLRNAYRLGLKDATPVQQEPVLRYAHIKCPVCDVENPGIHKCATPVRTKDLTDEEIWEVVKNCPVDNRIEAAKAAIAADREKNK